MRCLKMDKESFIEVLETALLNFSGMSESELIEKYDFSPELVRVGIQLCSYLKSKEVK